MHTPRTPPAQWVQGVLAKEVGICELPQQCQRENQENTLAVSVNERDANILDSLSLGTLFKAFQLGRMNMEITYPSLI